MVKRKIVASLENITVSFKSELSKKKTKIIRDTGFNVYEGEVLGIIGESGSGKSIITSLLNGMLPESGSIDEGKVTIFGKDVTKWTDKKWEKAKIRGTEVGKIFQNPISALNPNLKIKFQLIERMVKEKIFPTEKECVDEVIRLLEVMNIHNAKEIIGMYPHELSGGMIQRVVIAMNLALKPKLLILDEPTTALDPVVQADILDLINDIRKEYKTTMIFITHDIGVIAKVATRIAVMYAGRIIEKGDKDEVLYNPQHPYTWGLLTSLPSSNVGGELEGIKGVLDLSIIKDEQDGFVFRNKYALDIDLEKRPPMFMVNENHYAATWLLHPKAPKIKKHPFIVELNKIYKKGK